jgi:hypothetical protein
LNSSPLLLFYPLSWFLELFHQVSLLHLHTWIYITCTIFILLPNQSITTSSLPPMLWRILQPEVQSPVSVFLMPILG